MPDLYLCFYNITNGSGVIDTAWLIPYGVCDRHLLKRAHSNESSLNRLRFG